MFLFTFAYSPYYHPLGSPLGNLGRTWSCRSWSLRILRDAISASKETSTTTGCISETWGFWEPHVVFCFILFWCFDIFWPLAKALKLIFPFNLSQESLFSSESDPTSLWRCCDTGVKERLETNALTTTCVSRTKMGKLTDFRIHQKHWKSVSQLIRGMQYENLRRWATQRESWWLRKQLRRNCWRFCSLVDDLKWRLSPPWPCFWLVFCVFSCFDGAKKQNLKSPRRLHLRNWSPHTMVGHNSMSHKVRGWWRQVSLTCQGLYETMKLYTFISFRKKTGAFTSHRNTKSRGLGHHSHQIRKFRKRWRKALWEYLLPQICIYLSYESRSYNHTVCLEIGEMGRF